MPSTELAGFDGPVPDVATGYAEAGGEPVGGPVGTWTTVDDLRRWHAALADSSVLEADSIASMETPHVETDAGVAYGYGVEIRSVEGHREVAHRGGTAGFTGWLVRFPDDGIVIVLLSNVETAEVDRIRDEVVGELLESG
jgi:CubicO group peptidase (beta-lactamase class C family)